uniref:CPW-WPC domain-containing protein n=1 Tax=viral metagenome TaxID=1070528 RepID=A0A6C0KFH4_9ZZZZ
MNFQKIILIIATIILVFSLLTIGLLIRSSKTDLVFPPMIGQCPDYWKEISNNVCKNVLNLGKMTCDHVKDFSGSEYQGKQGTIEKCNWAKSCDLVWDGVTDKC